MSRDTSINAYNEIKSNGLLSHRRFEVYECLYFHGPMTENEIDRMFKRIHPTCNPAGFHARVSELEKMGVVKEVGIKSDEVSGHDTILWDVTSKMPVPLIKGKTKKMLIKELKEAVVSLGREVTNEKWKQQLREMYKKVLQLQ